MSTPLPDITVGQHRLDSGGPGTSEPVVLSHMVTTLLYLAAGLGLFTVSDRTVALVGVAVAVALSTIGALAARARVSPSGRITWDGVRGAMRAMVYEEIDRLAAAAPALTAATTVDMVTAALEAAAGPSGVALAKPDVSSSTAVMPTVPQG